MSQHPPAIRRDIVETRLAELSRRFPFTLLGTDIALKYALREAEKAAVKDDLEKMEYIEECSIAVLVGLTVGMQKRIEIMNKMLTEGR